MPLPRLMRRAMDRVFSEGSTDNLVAATPSVHGSPTEQVAVEESSAMIEKAGGYLAICAIMKNESIGVLEWIAYHRALGVEKFFLYDHQSEDDTVAKVRPLCDAGIVELVEWPYRPGQLQAYDDFARKHGADWVWCAFIDLDEFINPFGYDSIPEWLVRFEPYSAVAIQWVNFGPHGFEEPPVGLAIAAYTTRFVDLHQMHGHVKTIVRMEKYDRAQGPHSFFVTDGEVVDELERPVVRNGSEYAIQEPMIHEGICINHYYTRSRQEWWIKINRGLADAGDNPQNARNPLWIEIYERDATVEDERIAKFVPRAAASLLYLEDLREHTDVTLD